MENIEIKSISVTPELKQNLASLYSYLSKYLGIKTIPRLVFRNNKENSNDMLGFTGYYDSANKTIVLFSTDRHPKDILRSFAHEVIHYFQDLKGTLPHDQKLSSGYAQNDPHMRKMEMHAYLFGNILFRDWSDMYKAESKSAYEK